MAKQKIDTQNDFSLECTADLTAAQVSEWNAFLLAADHQHPRQSPLFASSEKALGRKVVYVSSRVGGKLTAVALISLDPHPYLSGAWAKGYCLSGPVCDNDVEMAEFLKAIAAHQEFAKVGSLNVTPFWTGDDAERLDRVLDQYGWRIEEEEKFRLTGWVDISGTPDVILQNFSKSARREVRRAERQGVEFYTAEQPRQFRVFLESMNRLRATRGLPPLNIPAYEAMFEDVLRHNEFGTVILVRQDANFLAGLLVYRSRDIVHGRHFTTEPDQLRAAGNLRIAPALWLEAMCWAKEKGCCYLDVEGYREPVSGDKKYNIHKYKSEFNPSVLRRLSERSMILNRSVYLTGNARSLLKGKLKKVKRAITSKTP